MNLDLAIAGQGAVLPTVPAQIEPSGRPGQTSPVLRVDLNAPAIARWQREPRLRRVSPITYFLVEAAAQALGGATPAERAQTGLIVAFSAGCLAYSRRFYEQIVRQGQRAASPALFPETVFNSPVSHVVTVLGLNGAAYALVGDESAWISALITASAWLKDSRVQQVLVLGAEEFDPLVLDAYHSAGWLRQKDFLTSEGAAGILVRPAQGNAAPLITTARDGFLYRTKTQAREAAQALLAGTDPTTPLLRTARHNCFAALEAKLTQNRPLAPEPLHLGEAFLASAAWRTLHAASLLGPTLPRLLLPIWGLNHQFGLLELTTAK